MRRSSLAMALACAAVHAGHAAPRVTFDAALLRNARGADVSAYEAGTPVQAGLHAMDVWRNGAPLGRRDVRFDGEPVAPCFDVDFATWLGVAITALSRAQRDALSGTCASVALLHPSASAVFDMGERTLHVSIPQALLAARTDAIDPATLDAGITAFRLGYALNVVSHDRRGGRDSNQASLRLDAGANVGPWRWRHRAIHAWRPRDARTFDLLAAHVERDVPRFDARMTLGNFRTTGPWRNALELRGVRFQSDDRMLPASQTRHAPVLRGIADTNARVQVRQGGRLLFDTVVPPGPFALPDVQPHGTGGDLDVRIEEADGRVRSVQVPYIAMPGLLRAGRKRFALAAGRLREEAWASPVVVGAFEAGIDERITLRIGSQATSGHVESALGTTFATRIGAWSFDRLHGTGSATRAAFTTGVGARTTLDLSASHRPQAFRAMHDAIVPPASHRERRRIDATLHATLGKRRHGMRVTAVERRFHATRSKHRSSQLSWALPAGRNGAMLHAALESTHGVLRATAHHATLALALPLRVGASTASAHVHARAAPDHSTVHTGMSAHVGQTAWNVGIARAATTRRTTYTHTAAITHAGRAGRMDAGLSVSPLFRQAALTLDGSVLAHPHGVTLGPVLGDTIALVRAQHGTGAKVLHAPGVRLDRHGHALVPHLTPYRRNRVGIEIDGASPDIAFDWTERDVVPRAGAVVDVALAGVYRPTRFVRIVLRDGNGPPFGTRITDRIGTTLARVGRDAIARVPADGTPWFIEGGTHRCTIEPATTHALPIATCPASNRASNR